MNNNHSSNAHRPRGLWRARARQDAKRSAATSPAPPRTRQLFQPPTEPVEVPQSSDDSYDSDSAFESDSESSAYSSSDTDDLEWTHRTKMLNTTSMASPLQELENQTLIDLDDWEDLKELFLKAQEHYDADDYDEALPVFRGVLHECHRFLQTHQDPSVLFGLPESPSSPGVPSRSTWSYEAKSKSRTSRDKSKPPSEVPTAFHTLLATTLLLFGIIIAQEPSLALPGEVSLPVPYWLAALATFETGDNVPARTHSISSSLEFPTDWRLAIMWGRTLVCLADEILTRAHNKPTSAEKAQEVDVMAAPSSIPHANDDAEDEDDDWEDYFRSPEEDSEQYQKDHPVWPKDSLLHLVHERRPLSISPVNLVSTPATELLHLAMDQFARGILHMPHQCHRPNSPSHGSHRRSSPQSGRHSRLPFHHLSFSRMRELYNIASSVLIVSEKLEPPAERKLWAGQADSLFGQMKVEMLKTSSLFGAGDVEKMRGRCWLVIGSAELETIEKDMEKQKDVMDSMDVDGVLNGPAANSARKGLQQAVELLTQSRVLILEGSQPPSATATPDLSATTPMARSSDDPISSLQEVNSLLAEALLSLANLTKDDQEREKLYARATEVFGKDLFVEDVEMDDG